MSKKQFQRVAATTHLDKHGERFTKGAFEQFVADFRAAGKPEWGYWKHLTTLPPLHLITNKKVQERADGEYELAVEGIVFEQEDFEDLRTSGILIPQVTSDAVAALYSLAPLPSQYLKVSYDPRNFEQDKANSAIASMNDLVPTQQEYIVRKAELPQAVVFVLVTFAGGFIARFGELAADKTLELVSSFSKRLNERFRQLLTISRANHPVDVVFEIPIADTSVIAEGAVENATGEQLEAAWRQLPDLYALATAIIERNRPEFFSHLKFLLNPLTRKWEVNYLTTRESHRVVLGPRYNNPSHPLRQRWENERQNYDANKFGTFAMSIGFIPKKGRPRN